MRKRNEDITWDVAGRIKDLDQFTGSLVAPLPRAEHDAIPIHEAPPTHVPVPRRARIFLRGAGGVRRLRRPDDHRAGASSGTRLNPATTGSRWSSLPVAGRLLA